MPFLRSLALLCLLLSALPAATIGSWQQLRAAEETLAEDDVETRMAAAIFLWSEGEQAEARRWLRAVLERDPDHAMARRMLGDAERQIDAPAPRAADQAQPRQEAETRTPEWYRAQGYRQHRGRWLREHDFRRLVAREQRLREELRQRSDWDKAWEFDSRFFRIKTNCSHQVALEIGHALDLCYETLALQVFDFDKPLPKVPVEVYATQEQFMRASARSGFAVGYGTLGYYYYGAGLAGIRCFYAGSIQQTLSTLFHECTHLVISQIVGTRVPTWSNEGLAVFFEDAERQADRIDLRAVPWGRLWQLHDQLAKGDISLDRLVTNETGYTAEYYPQGWALIHFLLFADDGRYRRSFMAYYDLLRKQDYRSNMEAFTKVFRCRPNDLYPEWKRYVLALEPQTPSELVAAAQEAAGRRYEFERATRYAERAREQAPEDGRVLVGYGRTYLYRALLAGDAAEARDHASRAAEALASGIARLDWDRLKPRREESVHLPLLAHVDHARARIAAGEWQRAQEVLHGVLDIDPFSSEASAYLALIAGSADDDALRDPRLAEEHLALADDIGRTHVNFFVRACLAEQRGDVATAIDLLYEAAERDRFGFGAGLYRRRAALLQRGGGEGHGVMMQVRE